MGSRLVDVSHVVESGMVTYRGLPAPLVCDYLSREASRELYAPGVEFHIGKVEMVANTGTYLDSPFHRYANGKDLSELPLERLANLQGIVIPADLSNGRAISSVAFKGHDLRGKAVLVRTGWDAHWRTDPYFEGHPFLTRDAAEYLLGAELLGLRGRDPAKRALKVDHADDFRDKLSTAARSTSDTFVEAERLGRSSSVR